MISMAMTDDMYDGKDRAGIFASLGIRAATRCERILQGCDAVMPQLHLRQFAFAFADRRLDADKEASVGSGGELDREELY